jgi:branched-subunit amino acid aminotransferase/4-amino-4-deoxychorismate lyase
MSFYDLAPFLWEKHWRRLDANARRLGIDIFEYTEESVRDAVLKTIEENGLASGRVRIAFLDDSAGQLWTGNNEAGTSLSILLGERRRVLQGIRLTVSPHRINTTSPLVSIKSCNYLEPLMAVDEAKTRGFDEAIRLNERGEIASTCMANVFWLKNQRLFTPGLETGCLAGTTREFILENLECEEVEEEIEAILEAEEIFLTSAGIGVVQVGEFEGRELRCGEHPITKVLPF